MAWAFSWIFLVLLLILRFAGLGHWFVMLAAFEINTLVATAQLVAASAVTVQMVRRRFDRSVRNVLITAVGALGGVIVLFRLTWRF